MKNRYRRLFDVSSDADDMISLNPSMKIINRIPSHFEKQAKRAITKDFCTFDAFLDSPQGKLADKANQTILQDVMNLHKTDTQSYKLNPSVVTQVSSY
ncbi:hypothetical protein MBANPS3_010148 [Mucor bainieri]